MSRFRILLLSSLCLMLSACKFVVLDPAGDVAVQQRDLLIDSTLLMLLIIVPVMALTVWVAWKYRISNKKNVTYEPEWEHSTHLELVIWAAPLMIVICLGALTWLGTHLLDPYRSLSRLAPGRAIAQDVEPLQVEVVSLDWKWLFIYPQYGIATVNELAAPVDRPIDFRVTSSSVMNSLFIPALAGQVYAMGGMETKLHSVINKAGKFEGFSANYSGSGFSGMHFAFYGQTTGDFAQWVANIKAAGGRLDRDAYQTLASPSENEPVRHYAAVDPKLYDDILRLCVAPGATCSGAMNEKVPDDIMPSGTMSMPMSNP